MKNNYHVYFAFSLTRTPCVTFRGQDLRPPLQPATCRVMLSGCFGFTFESSHVSRLFLSSVVATLPYVRRLCDLSFYTVCMLLLGLISLMEPGWQLLYAVEMLSMTPGLIYHYSVCRLAWDLMQTTCDINSIKHWILVHLSVIQTSCHFILCTLV